MRYQPTQATRALKFAAGFLTGIWLLSQGAVAAPVVEVMPDVTYEVLSLKRLGDKNLVELRYALDNQSSQDIDLDKIGLATFSVKAYYSTGVNLMDLDNAKVYYVGFADVRCFCTMIGNSKSTTLPSGERREFWGWYAAPGASVTKLAIFFPGVPPVLDVALEK